MKSTFICLSALAVLTLQHASAALIIQENFNYTVGAIGGQAASGIGLTGNWASSASSGSATFNVQAPSVVFTGHFASSGGSLIMSSGNGGEKRTSVAVSATIPVSTTFYASSLQTLNTAGQYFNDWVVEQRFNTTASGDFSTSSGRNVVAAFNSGTTSTRNAAVSSNLNEVSVASTTAGTTYLLVTAYTSDATNLTQARLFGFTQTSYANYLANSNPTNAAANLTTYASFTAVDTDTSPLANFDFLQYSITGGPTGQMDDFRLGTDITDVVNVIPEPSVTILGSLGVLALLRRSRKAEMNG